MFAHYQRPPSDHVRLDQFTNIPLLTMFKLSMNQLHLGCLDLE